MRTKVTLTTVTMSLFAALAVMAALSIWTKPLAAHAQGSTQISGVGFFAEPGECTDPQGQGSDFALRMTGDLQGCVYVFVETAVCSPAGTYNETGSEIFVGHYNGQFGTFDTSYQFAAKYEDCSNLTGEFVGRCEHPLVKNTGTGVFEGFTGRLDFKDDVEAGNFPYRGHLRQ
jgi:hypothetical protein